MEVPLQGIRFLHIPTDDVWTLLEDGSAPEAGPGDMFASGPAAAVIRDGRLLLFGSVVERATADQPLHTTAKAWSIDALALGLGPDVMMNAWWKDQGAGVSIGAAPDAGGPLSAANCPTLDEANAAVPEIDGVGELNAVPFKNMILQCSYTTRGLDRSGHRAGVGILVFDTEGLGRDMWAGVRTEPDRPDLVEIPELDAAAFATGEPGHEAVWVATDEWALHMSNTATGGVPLDQMTALARATLAALQRPPR
jgi:hypothetical protein